MKLVAKLSDQPSLEYRPGGAAMRISQVSNGWQARLRFYSKSASQKLTEISHNFGFEINRNILDDHDHLADLRWELQSRLGANNPLTTRALTNLFFTYLREGRPFLCDDDATTQLLDDLTLKFRTQAQADIPLNADSALPCASLRILDADTVNALMTKYHFLGYGRADGHHLGVCLDDGDQSLLAAATFSPWDLGHATPLLQKSGIEPREVLVLSRLLSICGKGRLALSKFISQLIDWVRKEMPQIKIIATYCNPNAGHYGTVYRGANFVPLFAEAHPFIPFVGNEYISPRKTSELCHRHGPDKAKALCQASAFEPVPLLIYYYPVRLPSRERGRIVVGRCVHRYPIDLHPVRPGSNSPALAPTSFE